jgi:6-phosphogluconolactonase
MKTKTIHFENLKVLSKKAAGLIMDMAKRSIRQKGYFTLAVSGGSDPVPTYKNLAKSKIDWSRIFIFWQDDRYVSSRDEKSNFKLVYDAMLSKIKIPPQNVFMIPSPEEINPAAKSALCYEGILKNFFNDRNTKPGFDLVIAGMGPDGHTSSLFPKDKKALNEKKRLIIAVKAPDYAPVRDRITMTLPFINNSKTVLYIIAGKGKGGIMKEILESPLKAKKKYPTAMVKAKENLIWMIDKNIYK